MWWKVGSGSCLILRGHKAKRLEATALKEVEFPLKLKMDPVIIRSAGSVAGGFCSIWSWEGLLVMWHPMCPELQCCNKWGQPPGSGLNSRQRLRLNTALHTGMLQPHTSMHVWVCKAQALTHMHQTVWSGPSGDRKWCKMTSVAPVPARDSLHCKQAELSLRTSPEVDTGSIDLRGVMWGRWWSLHRKWMLCKREEEEVGGWGCYCVIQSEVLIHLEGEDVHKAGLKLPEQQPVCPLWLSSPSEGGT